jgi:hypothetical protein
MDIFKIISTKRSVNFLINLKGHSVPFFLKDDLIRSISMGRGEFLKGDFFEKQLGASPFFSIYF